MPKLKPLWTPGGGRSSNRPAGIPSLITGPLANGVPYFEDFHAFSLATSGHPSWLHTVIAGTGTAGGGSSTTSSGQLLMLSAPSGGGTAASGDGHVVTASGRINTGANTSAGLLSTTSAQPWVAQFRFTPGGTITSLDAGVALIGGTIDASTNWLTDPDTTLFGGSTGANSIAFTRHAASYSGDTAGNLIVRFYEATGTDDASLDLGAVAVSAQIKVEVYWDGASLLFYRDGAYVGALAAPSVTTWTLKPSFAMRMTGAGNRTVSVDSYYQEVSLASAR